MEKGPDRITHIVVNVGMAVVALWLLTYLMPAGRMLMLDAFLSFLLSLMLTGLLWWITYRAVHPRRFWGFLAAAWTVGLVGNIAWGLYEAIAGQPLPRFSLVSVLYLARYLLILLAFWRGLGIPSGSQWSRLLIVLILTAAVVAGGFFLSTPTSQWTATWLSGALFPILDIALMSLALEAWMQEPSGPLRNTLGFLTLALLAYGAANWLNFFGQVTSLESVSGLAGLFWPLSDILTGIGVLYLLLTDSHDPGPQPANQG